MPLKQSYYTIALTKDEMTKLQEILEGRNYEKFQVQYAAFAYKGEDISICCYTSGKLVIQGKKKDDFILYTLEPYVTKRAEYGQEETTHKEWFLPHIGVDESGKGDYLGPMVACAVYTDENLTKKMLEMGVRDCKAISDGPLLKMAPLLRNLLGVNRYKIVKIGAEAYNKLYLKHRSISSILAWAHARAIEDLLTSMPNCKRVVVDQFGDENLVKNALMEKGKTIELDQHHKAESDIAVAAASIIARETFLLELKHLSTLGGIEFHKGATSLAVESATNLVKKYGPRVLPKTAKCHFKTTDAVLAKLGYARKDAGPLAEPTSMQYDHNFKKG